jgi:hypothetical protein
MAMDCDCCLPAWIWVILQLAFGGSLGGLVFQAMQVKGPEDARLVHPFLLVRAMFGGVGCAFGWLFLYIHLGKMEEITLSDIEICTVIVYSVVAGFVGLLFLRRLDLWK